jgi:hypothetical protein
VKFFKRLLQTWMSDRHVINLSAGLGDRSGIMD